MTSFCRGYVTLAIKKWHRRRTFLCHLYYD